LLADNLANIKDIFCYVLEHYGNSGLSVLVYRKPKDDQVVAICGDWYGNSVDLYADNELSKIALSFVQDSLHLLIKTMSLVKVDQAQFYFAISDSDLALVDMQVSLNKFVSPGMIRDIFGKVFNVQMTKTIKVIDDVAIDAIGKGCGSYEGDLIIKPSRFRLYHEAEDNTFQPMYIEVKR
tara:strand:+ start:272 stop:811 length:540 start_codon:yes stop_codon:yes gene_type:complete